MKHQPNTPQLLARPNTPQLLVEKLALGELTAEQEALVRERLDQQYGTGGAAKILTALAEDNEKILREFPATQVAAAIKNKAASSSKSSSVFSKKIYWSLVPVGAMAAASLLTIWLLRAPQFDSSSKQAKVVTALDTERIKGSALLGLFRATSQGPQILTSGDTATAGDLVQISYQAKDDAYGVIISVDGRGNITQHFPPPRKSDTKLQRQGVQLLPQSYELDDAPQYERFFFITANQPVNIEAVWAAARSLAPGTSTKLLVPSDYHYCEFLLRKSR